MESNEFSARADFPKILICHIYSIQILRAFESVCIAAQNANLEQNVAEFCGNICSLLDKLRFL